MSDPNMNLPVKTGDDFIGELETMDLSSLKSESFLVAVSSGDRSKAKFLPSTIRGVFTFEEMCETVGIMWKDHQHHAKVVILQKDLAAAMKILDENTVDYIEAHFQDIITESMLDGVFDDVKDYTCRAGIAEDDNEMNPFAQKKEEEAKVEEEDEDL